MYVTTADSDFTERGFNCVMEYLYTTKVRNVTCDTINKGKLRAAVQCAEFLGVGGLDVAAYTWAKQCSVDLEA
jgi:hypothetical protein